MRPLPTLLLLLLACHSPTADEPVRAAAGELVHVRFIEDRGYAILSGDPDFSAFRCLTFEATLADGSHLRFDSDHIDEEPRPEALWGAPEICTTRAAFDGAHLAGTHGELPRYDLPRLSPVPCDAQPK